MSNKDVRLWYKAHDERISEIIDKTKSIEAQAREAFELRNTYRTQARELMNDQKARAELDKLHINPTFKSYF